MNKDNLIKHKTKPAAPRLLEAFETRELSPVPVEKLCGFDPGFMPDVPKFAILRKRDYKRTWCERDVSYRETVKYDFDQSQSVLWVTIYQDDQTSSHSMYSIPCATLDALPQTVILRDNISDLRESREQLNNMYRKHGIPPNVGAGFYTVDRLNYKPDVLGAFADALEWTHELTTPAAEPGAPLNVRDGPARRELMHRLLADRTPSGLTHYFGYVD